MLLAAVHGLRLGALVQLLTFGGFFLGFVLGTLVWVPLLGSGHQDLTRSVLVVSLVMLTAWVNSNSWRKPAKRRPHGHEHDDTLLCE